MTEEKVLSSELIYEGRAFTVRVDTVRTVDGRETTRDIVEHSECVAIVAVDPDNKILLVKQYRLPAGKQLLEIPAGGIDGGEGWANRLCNHGARAALLQRLQQQRTAGNLPEVVGSGRATLRALIREYLFVSLFRACAESLASENASRLAAMQRAEKNIDELLEDLNGTFHRLRQSGIDEELFDVISGFEALVEPRQPPGRA